MKTLVREVEKKETLEELEERHKVLMSEIEEYLLLLGAEYSMLKAIIEDLKSQMYIHADSRINDMIADLINLENKIAWAKEEEKKMLNAQNQPF
ncbi:MAG: hypothetical protein IKD36_00740 [Clostridia bacterium]|nr:hypothetical protein [Clostridia bacterium]